MENTPAAGNLPTPDEAREALAVVRRSEQKVYEPRPIPLTLLIPGSVFVGLIWAGISSGGGWRDGAMIAGVVGLLAALAWQRWRGNTPQPRAMPRSIRNSALLPGLVGGILAGLSGPILASLIEQPYTWIVVAAAGVVSTLIAGLVGSWSYRRAYRRWLAEGR